jgi:WD40 repeat protein
MTLNKLFVDIKMKVAFTRPRILNTFLAILAIALIILTAQSEAYSTPVEKIEAIARQVIVKIDTQEEGSGVIIAKHGNIYHVATARHVVESEQEFNLITSDGFKHELKYESVTKIRNYDLAIIKFVSDRSYQIAKTGSAKELENVYAAGYPKRKEGVSESILKFSAGKIKDLNARQSEDEKYKIVYDCATEIGMSGGGVFNSEGKLIAIHGKGDAASSAEDLRESKINNSFGVPINDFLRLADFYGVNLTESISLKKIELNGESILGMSSCCIFTGSNEFKVREKKEGVDIKVWNISNGKLLQTIHYPTKYGYEIASVSLSPDGKTIAVSDSGGNGNSIIKIYKVKTLKQLNRLVEEGSTGTYSVTVLIAPDNAIIVGWFDLEDMEGKIHIWDLKSKLNKYIGGGMGQFKLAISQDNKIIIGMDEEKIFLWGRESGKLLKSIDYPNYSIGAIAINHENLLMMHKDGRIESLALKGW